MAESWYSIIRDEMSSVDDVIRDEVRSAYPELNDMCEATMRSRYHTVRPALCILSYHLCGGKDRDLAIYTASCFESVFEGLHLHDRIDSEGKVVGGKKKLFDKVPSTTKVIVAGDFMYLMGFRLAYAKAPKVVPYLMSASASISDGIFMIANKEHNPSVTEQDCMDITVKKGAIEYQTIMACAAEQAGADDDAKAIMQDCGEYIGMALQIESDLDDLFKDKPEMFTIKTGYPTLPIFYSMQDPEYGERIRELYSRKDLDQKEMADMVSMIKRTDATKRCEELIVEYYSEALKIINGLPASDYSKSLSDFVRNNLI